MIPSQMKGFPAKSPGSGSARCHVLHYRRTLPCLNIQLNLKRLKFRIKKLVICHGHPGTYLGVAGEGHFVDLAGVFRGFNNPRVISICPAFGSPAAVSALRLKLVAGPGARPANGRTLIGNGTSNGDRSRCSSYLAS
jgi:hypothetical protein